jgi:hypothetical protein
MLGTLASAFLAPVVLFGRHGSPWYNRDSYPDTLVQITAR